LAVVCWCWCTPPLSRSADTLPALACALDCERAFLCIQAPACGPGFLRGFERILAYRSARVLGCTWAHSARGDCLMCSLGESKLLCQTRSGVIKCKTRCAMLGNLKLPCQTRYIVSLSPAGVDCLDEGAVSANIQPPHALVSVGDRVGPTGDRRWCPDKCVVAAQPVFNPIGGPLTYTV
jgi:hypothetical protein